MAVELDTTLELAAVNVRPAVGLNELEGAATADCVAELATRVEADKLNES